MVVHAFEPFLVDLVEQGCDGWLRDCCGADQQADRGHLGGDLGVLPVAAGLLDFFVLEASDYVESLDGLESLVDEASTLIDYRLQLNGIPIGWQSRIENWQPARRFIDTQVKGPYSYWHHAHEFIPLANGTLMRDVVRCRLPFGWLGSVVAGRKVESRVNQIFSYRSTRIAERFAA